jgi:hypothetical protein
MNSLQAAGFPFAYTDMTEAWVNLDLPFLPMSALRAVQSKNAAALTNASQVVIECLQTLTQRQAQFFTSTIDDSSNVTRSFEESVMNQADFNRHVVGHFQELSNIAVKANVTAIDILNGRITEAFDELKSVFAKPLPLNSIVPSEAIGADIAMIEHAATVEDVIGQNEPEPTVKIRKRKKVVPASKAVRRRTSRRR